MIPYVLHDATGRIRQTGSAPEFMIPLQEGPGLTLVRGEASEETHYVKKGAIVPRPASPAELAGKVLIGLPTPCVIRINQASYNCNEPVATLDFPYAGTYRITVVAFPYLDGTFTLEQA